MDIVIVSTGAKHYVLTRELVERAIKRRNYEPMFVIDISVPRNADPKIGEIDSVFLYDIDDLKQVVEENLKGRLEEAKKGEIILWDEVKKFVNWYRSLKVEPLILELKKSVEGLEESKYLKKVVHRAIEQMKKNPEVADIILKIFKTEEVKKHESGRKELSDVYNRAYGT